LFKIWINKSTRLLGFVPEIKDDIYEMTEVNIPFEKCIKNGKFFIKII